MARYTRADGARWIMGESGHGWVPTDGAYVRDGREGPVFTLEKRRRDPENGTADTGWYLSDDRSGGFLGEWCGSRLLEAVDKADLLIRSSGS